MDPSLSDWLFSRTRIETAYLDESQDRIEELMRLSELDAITRLSFPREPVPVRIAPPAPVVAPGESSLIEALLEFHKKAVALSGFVPEKVPQIEAKPKLAPLNPKAPGISFPIFRPNASHLK